LLLGTANIHDVHVLQEALRVGYRMLDTGLLYGNHKQVAAAINRSGINRADLFLITKVSFYPALGPLASWALGLSNPQQGGGINIKGLESEALQLSLQELQTSYADLCLLHSPVTSFWELLAGFLPHRIGRMGALRHVPSWAAEPLSSILQALNNWLTDANLGFTSRKDAWQSMEKAHQQGQCKFIGVSNYVVPLLQELETYARIMPAANEVEMHPMFQSTDVQRYCKSKGIALIAYGNGIALQNPTVQHIAHSVNKTSSQVLLQWALQNDASVIPRTSNVTRLQENLLVNDFHLGDQDVKKINELNTERPFYWDMNSIQLRKEEDQHTEARNKHDQHTEV